MTDTKRISIANEVRRLVLGSKEQFWRVDDLTSKLDASSSAVVSELERLQNDDQVEHVRRGLWWRGRPTKFGMSLPRPGDAVRAVVGDREAIGAAEWHATNLLGLSTQVVPREILAITTRPPTGIDGVRMINRSSRTGRRDARLNDLEVTLLEAIDGWDRYVERPRGEATERFVELLGREDVRIPRLAKAAGTESPIVRERLRALLERGGWAEEASAIPRAGSAGRKRALAVVEPAAA